MFKLFDRVGYDFDRTRMGADCGTCGSWLWLVSNTVARCANGCSALVLGSSYTDARGHLFQRIHGSLGEPKLVGAYGGWTEKPADEGMCYPLDR